MWVAIPNCGIERGSGDFGKYIKHGRKRTIINNGSSENRRVDGGMNDWLATFETISNENN